MENSNTLMDMAGKYKGDIIYVPALVPDQYILHDRFMHIFDLLFPVSDNQIYQPLYIHHLIIAIGGFDNTIGIMQSQLKKLYSNY